MVNKSYKMYFRVILEYVWIVYFKYKYIVFIFGLMY